MKHKLDIALLAIFVIATVGILGPSLDFFETRSAAGDAAVIEHRAAIKVLQAAIEMCGGNENATAVDLGGGRWQCLSTGGRVLAEVGR